MSVKRSVYGVGINDAVHNIVKFAIVGGKRKQVWLCPFYSTWRGMLKRCYCKKEHQRYPTYKCCSVCDEWLIFSNFKAWMEKQDWEGKHLDKDLLVINNKCYSPDHCIFVDHKINIFVTDSGGARGEYMIGVSWHKASGKFRASCGNPFTGRYEHLGLFTDELEAHLAWKARKHELACELADSDLVTDERLAEALRNRYK